MKRTILLIAALALATGVAAQKRDADVTALDGVKLKVTYYPAAAPGPGVILLHMCNSSRAAWATLAPKLNAAGIHVLAMDYRGYGESGGQRVDSFATAAARQQVIAEKWPGDMDAAFEYLRAQKGVDQERIGAAGGSCGVNQSIQLARRHPEVKSLVLLSGSTDSGGREFLRRANNLPVLASAADDDGGAVATMRFVLSWSRNPNQEFIHYTAGGHGTDMFAAHSELEPKIVAWFRKTLVESPVPSQMLAAGGAAALQPTPTEQFWTEIDKPGSGARARQIFEEARKRDASAILFPEAEMNALGYEKLGDGATKDAIEILRLNVDAYPGSPNAYDSLADAYLADGQRDLALQYTEKAIEVLKATPNLDPNFRALVQQSIDAKMKQLKPSGDSGGSGGSATQPGAATSTARMAAPMPPTSEIWPKPIVYSVPGMEKIQPRADIVYKTVNGAGGKLELKLDAYIPAGAKAGDRFPAVILISGGGGAAPGEADWRKAGVYTSYGRLLAASGFVALPFTKRYARGYETTMNGEEDTLDLVKYVRAHNAELNVDPDRIAVWVFSGGGWMMAPFLRERPTYVRALVAFYAVLDVPADSSMPDTVKQQMVRFSSAANAPFRVGGCCAAPVFIARAGLDGEALNAGIDRFVAEAKKEGNYIDVELMEHPQGRHGFDILDDNERSREIIRAAVAFLKKNMGMQTAQQ